MDNLPSVYVVIVNWNGEKVLKPCLESIINTNYPNFKIIVVDNGSVDGSVGMVRKNFERVTLIENEKNLGVAKARNMGIKYAIEEGASYIFMLDNDTKVMDENWLTKLVKVAEENFGVGIVGCRLVYPNGVVQNSAAVITIERPGGTPCHRPSDKLKDVDIVVGGVSLIKREVVQKIGLLDESFSPAYFEDTDYCFRAKKAGYRVVCTSKVTIIHYGGVAIRKLSKPYYYFLHRNRLRFMLLNFPLWWLIKRPKYEIKTFMSFLFELKNGARTPGLSNVKLRKGLCQNTKWFLKGYFENIKSLNEIVRKRMYRRHAHTI